MHSAAKSARLARSVLDCGGAPPLSKTWDKAGHLIVGPIASAARRFPAPERGEELKVRGENGNQFTVANN